MTELGALRLFGWFEDDAEAEDETCGFFSGPLLPFKQPRDSGRLPVRCARVQKSARRIKGRIL